MGKSNIEWTDYTWNPWQGCRKVSPACDHCYMYRDKRRFGQKGSDIHRSSDATFKKPLGLPPGSRVFTCSWSDFFLEEADEWREEAWEIIRRTPHLTYQILTKRPENIKDRLPADWEENFRHVWLGVTAENQKMANKRIPILLEVPAEIRFVSIEPMIRRVNLKKVQRYCWGETIIYNTLAGRKKSYWGPRFTEHDTNRIDWVIVGGESGPDAREMKPEWVEAVYEQCREAKTPFFFKQWGAKAPADAGSYPFEEVKEFPRVETGNRG